MRTTIVIILVMLAIAIVVAIAVVSDPWADNWRATQGSPLDPIRATEMYGAAQWHAQLTAWAEETAQP